MAKSTQKTLLILGGFVFGVLLGCAGLSALAVWGLSSLFGEGEAEITVAGQIGCPAGPVRVVNHHRVTNRLAGVTNDTAFVVVDGVDVPLSRGTLRDWIPAQHLPPHHVDGDASTEGFEVFLDPELLPMEKATALEACLVGRREELLSIIHRTAAHSWMPEEDEGVIYWRASRDDLEPLFRHPNGEMIHLVDGGMLSHENGQYTATAGRVTRREDGSFYVRLRLGLDGPWPTPIAGFVDEEGRTIEQYFGVPVDSEYEGGLF